jgi:hypothetical protein
MVSAADDNLLIAPKVIEVRHPGGGSRIDGLQVPGEVLPCRLDPLLEALETLVGMLEEPPSFIFQQIVPRRVSPYGGSDDRVVDIFFLGHWHSSLFDSSNDKILVGKKESPIMHMRESFGELTGNPYRPYPEIHTVRKFRTRLIPDTA